MPESPYRAPQGGWRSQAVIAGAGILVGSYDLAAIAVALDPLRTQWHLSSFVVTTLGSITLVGMLLGSLGTGILADRFGRRRLILADFLLFLLTTLAAAAAPNFPVLASARFLTGIAVGMDFAVVFPFVAELAPAHRRGPAMAWIMWAANFGTLAAYALGALLLHIDPIGGWRPTLAVGALLALPVLLLRGRLLESPAWDVARLPNLVQIARSTAAQAREGELLAMSVATFLYQVSDQGLGLVLPLLLATVLSASAASGAASATAVKAVTIPAATLTVFLIQRLGRRRLQVVGFALRALAFTALGMLLIVYGQIPAWVVGLLLACGYFFGAAGPDKTTVIVPAEAFPSSVRSTSQGLSQASGRLGGIVGVTVYAALAGVGGAGAGLVFFGATSLAGALVSVIGVSESRPRSASGAAATRGARGGTRSGPGTTSP